MIQNNEFPPPAEGMSFIRSSDLVDMRFERTDWLVDGLLKPGLSVLAGSPKIGKSWLVLQLCMCVAKGEPFCGLKTRRGTVAYISLEDSYARLQERILRITEEAVDNLAVSLECPPLGDGLMRELADFCTQNPDTRLIVIDTFQKIRERSVQMSYANDYAEVSFLKKIADELHICILLVHHTRKMTDSDYINEISGTNGIAGSADTLMLLKKQKRTAGTAVLSCTGRDIEDRELTLRMDRESCLWSVTADSVPQRQPEELPRTMVKLVEFAARLGYYDGSNTDFFAQFSSYCAEELNPSRIKRMMNRYRYQLEEQGVYFLSAKSHGYRRLAVYYKSLGDGAPPQPSEQQTQAPPAEELSGYDDELPPAEELSGYDDELPPPPGDEDAPPENRFAYGYREYEDPDGGQPARKYRGYADSGGRLSAYKPYR